ncbi:MAG TPA: hypothetical protein VIL20_05165 [Sandaracinaceae bacterium]
MTKPIPLVELLADPETHEPVRRATPEELEAVARALREKRARVHGGGEPPARIEGAYVGGGGRFLYPDVDGMPSLLVEERIELDEPLGGAR